jgi:hypothetical protein
MLITYHRKIKITIPLSGDRVVWTGLGVVVDDVPEKYIFY